MKRTEPKRIKQSPKLPAGERREQLLRAAGDLFFRKGYQATGTEEIAKAAGLTKGALYFHFSSKEDIILALIRQIIDGHHAAVAELSGQRLNPADMLLALREVDRRMPLREARRNLSLMAEVIKIPKVRKMIDTAYQRSIEQMTASLDPAFGKTAGERRRLVEMLHALYDGICFAGMIHQHPGDVEYYAETLAKMVSRIHHGESKKK